jgi:hypothetical protein
LLTPRAIETTSSQPAKDVLATRGGRLMLVRLGWEGTDGLVGPSESEWLLLIDDEAWARFATLRPHP